MKRAFALAAVAAALLAAGGAASAAPAARNEKRVSITVTRNGFEPAVVRLKTGQPVRLVVTRKVERTCVTDIVLKDYGIRKPLPLNQSVEIRFTPRRPGAIRYACAMDMVAGSLIVE